VTEIVKGRQVLAYDVLVRITDGLGIPRGYMGLAYDQTTTALIDPDQPEEVLEDVRRRAALAMAALTVVGKQVLGEVLGLDGVLVLERLAMADKTPLPSKIGRSDVAALRALNEKFRALGRAGQAGMPDVMCPIAERADPLLTVAADDDVLKQIQSALAELHTLTGWCCYDMHLTNAAIWHYGRAIKFAGDAGDVIEMVDAASHAALGFHELGQANDALKLYQLAQAKLDSSPDDPPTNRRGNAVNPASQLHARIAHVWADLDQPEHARRVLERARQLPQSTNPIEQADLDYKTTSSARLNWPSARSMSPSS
jgi:hypothetical protein